MATVLSLKTIALQLEREDVRMRGLSKLNPWSKSLKPREKALVKLACKESREYYMAMIRENKK